MFILGLVHDVGKFMKGLLTEHASRGGEFLKSHHYKYWKEVFYHGKKTNQFSSEELNLLNISDLHVSCIGKCMTFTQYLEDVTARWGKQSSYYEKAAILGESLGLMQ